MNNYSKVFHVGSLDLTNLANRPMTSMSYEGNGLSVSHFPDEWTMIAKLGGQETFVLFKEDPVFYLAGEDDSEAIQWCLENEYLVKKKKYKALFSDEDGDEYFFELDTKKEAEEESEDVEPFMSYSFGPKGRSYWKNNFSSKISHSWAVNFASVFYAEAHGYDGVWWHENLDVSQLSAPRGVIFQHKLSEWTVALSEK